MLSTNATGYRAHRPREPRGPRWRTPKSRGASLILFLSSRTRSVGILRINENGRPDPDSTSVFPTSSKNIVQNYRFQKIKPISIAASGAIFAGLLKSYEPALLPRMQQLRPEQKFNPGLAVTKTALQSNPLLFKLIINIV